MKKNNIEIHYIEHLTAFSWLFYFFSHLLKNRKKIFQTVEHVYYFDSSSAGLWLATFTAWATSLKIRRAGFSQGETRDYDGNLVWMNTIKDALLLVEDIKSSPGYQNIISRFEGIDSLNLYCGKMLMCNDLTTTDAFLLLKFIFLIRCIAQQEASNRAEGFSERKIFLFMQERPWLAEFAKFAISKGITVISTSNIHLYFKVVFSKFDFAMAAIKDACKRAVYYWMIMRYALKKRNLANQLNLIRLAGAIENNDARELKKDRLRIAVEYYGYLNFNSPEMYSDLFFVKKSSLPAEDVLIYFGLPSVPIGDKELHEIQERGMAAIVTNPLASVTPNAPLFVYKRRKMVLGRFNYEDEKLLDSACNNQWLQRHIFDYFTRSKYWADFFDQNKVKIHVTWFKYSADHCAILDALKTTGGIGVVYERSCDHFLAPWTFTTADVVFGFSKWGAHLGNDKNSRIPYYVVTGYLGDFRFTLLRKRADQIRNLIKSCGAKKIVAYFDEHARDHSRWNLAYKVTLEHYTFLLTKVLENPWFGLILKPKVPASLRSRLGPVSDLLQRAEATGRCYVFEDGTVQGSYPPAAASLGADIAIHGHLFAATAGVESALAGVPTLFMDCEGVSESPLRVLGEGKVIFKDTEYLWQTLLEHWDSREGIPGFGDWSRILNDLDPFRDGKAAERMGTYLEWLMDGFKQGLSKDIVLADAAERYAKLWGKDKILSVNASSDIEDFSKICLT